MSISPLQCGFFDSASKLCKHKELKGRPCPILTGRNEDMCPRSRGYREDQTAQNEDAGER